MEILEFFKKYDKKSIEYDGAFPYQCVDFIKAYFDEVLGIKPEAIGNAVDYYRKYEKLKYLYENFDFIVNTKEFIPKLGDVMIWNEQRGKGCGHVAVCTGEGTTSYFYSYDQNWNNKKYVQKVKHNYQCVLGVLRPKIKKQVVIHEGDIVKVSMKVLLCGANRIKNSFIESMVEHDHVQFWARDNEIVGNIFTSKWIVAHDNGGDKCILALKYDESVQFWVEKSIIEKV